MKYTIYLNRWVVGLMLIFARTILQAQSPENNHIRTLIPQIPVLNSQQMDTLSMDKQFATIEYVDGLGRTVQSSAIEMAPNHGDMISFHAYDLHGRETRTYLPFTKFGAGGQRLSSPVSDQSIFYQSTALVAQTNHPYAETVFDNSPANRPKIQGAPGSDFQIASGHVKESRYITNTIGHPVRWWTLEGSNAVSNALYPINELTGTHFKDEDDGEVYEFTDKLGRTVYRKVKSADITAQRTGGGNTQWHETYWVYDDFGQLAFVIPPKAMAYMSGANSYDLSSLTEDLVFHYQYDKRRRLIESRTPGSAPHYFIYNDLDQLILSQDGNLRLANKWRFRKYDRLGRSIVTGLFDNNTHVGQAQMQAWVDQLLSQGSTENHERRSSTNFVTLHGYSDESFPGSSHSSGFYEIHSVNYYDDYDFNRDGQPDVNWTNDPDGEYANSSFLRLKDKLTGTKVRIMNRQNVSVSNQWIETVSFYDDYGREVHTRGNDHLGVIDLFYARYDLVGKLESSKRIHRQGAPDQVTVRIRMDYDHGGRLVRQWQQLNEDPEIIMGEFHYNQLGKLIEKDVHMAGENGVPLQSIDYRYHIRGWLTTINEIDPVTGGTEGAEGEEGHSKGGNTEGGDPIDPTDPDDLDLFALRLHYNEGLSDLQADPLYSGNISGMEWRSRSDEVVRAYGYQFDTQKRLTSAFYAARDGHGNFSDEQGHYDVPEISYDPNGNLLRVKRQGKVSQNQFSQIDDLQYGYEGNQLTSVTDFSSQHGTEDFQDNGANSGPDYEYDANGNLISDANKGITVSYDHNNLPLQIDFGQGRRIEYLYDALGTKLRKRVLDYTQSPLVIEQRDYMAGFVYQDGELEFLATTEGRAVPVAKDGQDFRYEYHYTDHLGNLRVAYSDLDGNGEIDPATEIIQEEHYYPYGMRMLGMGSEPIGTTELRTYNGKERQDDFGLGWMDYGARMYDPALGRWHSVDPAAGEFPGLSPYNYVVGNPILLVDPNGRNPILFAILRRVYEGDIAEGIMEDLGIDPNSTAGQAFQLIHGVMEVNDLEGALRGMGGKAVDYYETIVNVGRGNIDASDAMRLLVAPFFTGDERAEQLARLQEGDLRVIGNLLGEGGVAVAGGAVSMRGGAVRGRQVRTSNQPAKPKPKSVDWAPGEFARVKGALYELHVAKKVGASKGGFTSGGKQFDGAYGDVWYEAKSGQFWDVASQNVGKWKSKFGDYIRGAKDNGKTWEIYSENEIPQVFKDYFDKQGIKYHENF